jgi:GT2 family glycosyltransferase
VAGFARPRILKESPKGVAVDIFYAMGSALVTRSELFFRLGMFDEDYFYWYDDVDYCWRVRLAGFKVVCVMDASVHHYGSATFGKDNPILNYYWIRNNLCMCSKNYRYRELILTTPIRIGEIIIGGLGHNLSSRNTSGLKLSIKGLIDGIKDSPLFLRKRAVLKGLRARNSVAELLDPHIDIELLLGWVLPRFNNWIPRY